MTAIKRFQKKTQNECTIFQIQLQKSAQMQFADNWLNGIYSIQEHYEGFYKIQKIEKGKK